MLNGRPSHGGEKRHLKEKCQDIILAHMKTIILSFT